LKSKLHRAEFNNGVIGTSNVRLKESVQSRNPFAIGGKLMNALTVFISDCINLHSIIIDSLQMDSDFVTGLGEALTTSKSGEDIFSVYALKWAFLASTEL
jgi:hypothetical protein